MARNEKSKSKAFREEVAAQIAKELGREIKVRERATRSPKPAPLPAEGKADFHKVVEGTNAKKAAGAFKGGQASPKVTRNARDAMAAAFDGMGGVPALVKWGKSNPTEFYRLWARLIPKESYEASVQVPLEVLLGKLSNQASHSVSDAAYQVGHELLEYGATQAAIQDAEFTQVEEDE